MDQVNQGENMDQVNQGENMDQVNQGENMDQVNQGENMDQVNQGENMDQVNQGENSNGSTTQLGKRGRGRPRKDQSLKPTGNADVANGSAAPNQHLPQTADPSVVIDPLVGQEVTCVIEGTFDAGYLVSVRIPNFTTNLRGVVFKPGHYFPITAENDIAPYLPMIRRMQTVPPKRKYTPRKAGPSIHPVGHRAKLVPVVLQPISPPNFGQGQKMEPMTSDIDATGSSQTPVVKIENVLEAVVSKQEPEIINMPFSTECFGDGSVANPFFSYGNGNMNELLQVVNGNMNENKVQIEERAALEAKVEVDEKMITDADEEKAASVP